MNLARHFRPTSMSLLLAALLLLCSSVALASEFFLTTVLRGSNHVPPVFTGGIGAVDLVVNDQTGEIHWDAIYSGLVGSATGLRLHRGAAGTTGPVILVLTSSALPSPAGGDLVASPGVVDELLQGNVYVNLLSSTFPQGELRGQILNTGPIAVVPTTWGATKSLYRD